MIRIFTTSKDKNLLNIGLLLLRVTAGSFLLTHGLQKYNLLLKGGPIEFIDPIGIGPSASLILAVFAEVVCALLLIVGFGTRLILVPLIITMFVAVFIVHASDGFAKQELGGLYLVIFIFLFLSGSGKYSIDRYIYKNNRNTIKSESE